MSADAATSVFMQLVIWLRWPAVVVVIAYLLKPRKVVTK